MGVSPVRIGGQYSNEAPGIGPRKQDAAGADGAPRPAKPGQNAAGLEVSRTHEALIRRAAAAEEVDVKGVEAARKALQAGELDTPEAARRAAQSILDIG